MVYLVSGWRLFSLLLMRIARTHTHHTHTEKDATLTRFLQVLLKDPKKGDIYNPRLTPGGVVVVVVVLYCIVLLGKDPD